MKYLDISITKEPIPIILLVIQRVQNYFNDWIAFRIQNRDSRDASCRWRVIQVEGEALDSRPHDDWLVFSSTHTKFLGHAATQITPLATFQVRY